MARVHKQLGDFLLDNQNLSVNQRQEDICGMEYGTVVVWDAWDEWLWNYGTRGLFCGGLWDNGTMAWWDQALVKTKEILGFQDDDDLNENALGFSEPSTISQRIHLPIDTDC